MLCSYAQYPCTPVVCCSLILLTDEWNIAYRSLSEKRQITAQTEAAAVAALQVQLQALLQPAVQAAHAGIGSSHNTTDAIAPIAMIAGTAASDSSMCCSTELSVLVQSISNTSGPDGGAFHAYVHPQDDTPTTYSNSTTSLAHAQGSADTASPQQPCQDMCLIAAAQDLALLAQLHSRRATATKLQNVNTNRLRAAVQYRLERKLLLLTGAALTEVLQQALLRSKPVA